MDKDDEKYIVGLVRAGLSRGVTRSRLRIWSRRLRSHDLIGNVTPWILYHVPDIISTVRSPRTPLSTVHGISEFPGHKHHSHLLIVTESNQNRLAGPATNQFRPRVSHYNRLIHLRSSPFLLSISANSPAALLI